VVGSTTVGSRAAGYRPFLPLSLINGGWIHDLSPPSLSCQVARLMV
jgi:hypothetical protein